VARKHARIFDWALALLVACAPACVSFPQRYVPMVARPDTRRVVQVTLDSAVMAAVMDVFHAAYPREGAVCLTGIVRDTVVDAQSWLAVQVTGATAARSDSADEYHVYFSGNPRTGCETQPGLVGAAHDHVISGYACTHSYPDANVLFVDPRLLFTLVFCSDGTSEALYQDGRRVTARWAPEIP
jgi:hypothetical protein